jgi:hypothetical protein
MMPMNMMGVAVMLTGARTRLSRRRHGNARRSHSYEQDDDEQD